MKPTQEFRDQLVAELNNQPGEMTFESKDLLDMDEKPHEVGFVVKVRNGLPDEVLGWPQVWLTIFPPTYYERSCRGKVRLSSLWAFANNKCHKIEGPSIMVTVERGVEVVAKEFKRRMLRDLMAAWEKGCAKLSEEMAFARGVAGVKEMLVREGWCTQGRPDSDVLWVTGAYGKVQVNSQDSVSLTLGSMSPEKAVKVLEIYRKGKVD